MVGLGPILIYLCARAADIPHSIRRFAHKYSDFPLFLPAQSGKSKSGRKNGKKERQ
jgi:hypothetical protein